MVALPESLPGRGCGHAEEIDELINKADDISKLINRPWTDQEIAAKLKRAQDLKNMFNGVNRIQLEADLKTALGNGNTDSGGRAAGAARQPRDAASGI